MEWNEYRYAEILKEGAICRTEDDEFFIAGVVNIHTGTNDEFIADVTHYTNEFVCEVKELIERAKIDYEANIK